MTDEESEAAAQAEKQALFDFVKKEVEPMIIYNFGAKSEQSRMCRLLYFVLRNRTEEHWGPKELTMDVAMRLP